MSKKQNPHIHLPLGRLLAELKRKGFRIGADVYVDVEAYLMELGEDWEKGKRDEAKEGLALLIAKSEREQKRFFQLFDEYYPAHTTIQQKEKQATVKRQTLKRKRLSRWGLGILVSLLLLLIAGWASLFLVEDTQQVEARFTVSDCIRRGQDVHFQNASYIKESELAFLRVDREGSKEAWIHQEIDGFIWDFGDGTTDTETWSPKHTYEREGVYKTSLRLFQEGDTLYYRDSLQVDGKLGATIRMQPENPSLGDTLRLSFDLEQESEIDSLKINWRIEGQEISTDSSCIYVCKEAKHYRIVLSLQDKGDCSSITDAKNVNLTSELAQIGLYPFAKDALERLKQRLVWVPYLYWGLGLVITLILAYLLGLLWEGWMMRIPTSIQAEVDEALKGKHELPYWLSTPSKRNLIQIGSVFFKLAATMRLRQDSERLDIDIPKTLETTIEKGGIPHLRHKPLSKAVPYLVLIEQGSIKDQQSKLFQYWMELLEEEAEVEMERYLFRDDPRYLVSPDRGEEIRLTELAELYPDHHLLILSKGKGMMNQIQLKSWVRESFETWEHKFLLTPAEVWEWNYQELALEEVFTLYPMSAKGQSWMAEGLTEGVRKIKTKELQNSMGQEKATTIWDLYTYEGLSQYLDSISATPQHKAYLQEWIAATVVYPEPDLNTCLLVGELLEKEQTYENLYILTRIPWMQDGRLPADLRYALLETLPEETLDKVRQLLKKVLGDIKEDLNPQSRASVLLAIHSYILSGEPQGATRPSQKKIQYLDDLYRLPDSVVFKEPTYRKSRGALGVMILLFGMICLLKGWQTLSDKKALSDDSLWNQLYQTAPIDSATYYMNVGVEKLYIHQADSAGFYFKEALRVNPFHKKAQEYLNALPYYRGEQAYKQGESKKALAYFKTQVGHTDERYALHRLHSIGLCHYYAGELDSARIYRDSILEEQPSFFIDWRKVPNLFTLFITPDEIEYLLNEADSLRRISKYEEALIRYHSVLMKDKKNRRAKQGAKNCKSTVSDENLISPDTVFREDTIAILPDDITIIDSNQVEDAKPAKMDELDMVWVEGGTFMMGSEEYEWEKPVHEVEVESYYMLRTEVTFEMYDAFCDSIGRTRHSDEGWGRGQYPVVNVSWYDAVLYCNWISEQHGYQSCYTIDSTQVDPNNKHEDDEMKWLLSCDFTQNGYRLPTEAEWEYAAKGGQRSKGYIWAGTSNENSLDLYMNICDENCGREETLDDGYTYVAPVGMFRSNELGLYDMSGNVWEWCWDWYGDYTSEFRINPIGVSSGYVRVCRGGGWGNYAVDARIATRLYLDDIHAHRRFNGLGFRLLRAGD